MALSNRSGGSSRKAIDTAIRETSAANSEENPLVEVLRRQVANAYLVYLNYKHYHWQTFGPLFRDLHKLFDEFAEESLETTDDLAERMRMIGQDPPFHPAELEAHASVKPGASDAKTMRAMVEEAARHAVLLISEFRHAVTVAEEHDDPGSVDLFSKIVQIYEKQEWWLRDILEKGDGFFRADA
jgi:starvation-inducible DNA-binding protein